MLCVAGDRDALLATIVNRGSAIISKEEESVKETSGGFFEEIYKKENWERFIGSEWEYELKKLQQHCTNAV
jgi:hypothetical protein